MKILLLSQGRKIADQPDFDKALRNATFNGQNIELLNIPYVGYVQKYGGEAFYNEVVKANAEFRPDLVFFQFFHSGGVGNPSICVDTLKRSQNRPIIMGSVGDLFDTGALKFLGSPLPKHTLQLASCADAFFSTSMGRVANELVRFGAKNVVFLPNAFCTEHFPDWKDDLDLKNRYNVVMVGSRGRLISRHPKRALGNGWKRLSVVKALHKEFGDNFKVFGAGWKMDCCDGFCPPLEQVRLYQASHVVVDAPAPIIDSTYYSSDRAFFILGSGTPMVFFATPRFEKIFRPDEHAFFVSNKREMLQACHKGLRMTKEQLLERRRKIIDFVSSRHLISHRMDTLLSVFETIQKVRDGKLTKENALNNLRLWHFLPEVDLNEEMRYAVANWQG